MSALVDQHPVLASVPESPPKDDEPAPLTVEAGGAAEAMGAAVDDLARGLASLAVPAMPTMPQLGIFEGESSDEEPSETHSIRSDTESTASSSLAESLNAAELHDMMQMQREPTDRYGFFLSADKEQASKARQPTKREVARRKAKEVERASKWLKMTKRWSSYNKNKSSKLKRRIRKGVPDMWRGRVWQILGNIDDQMRLNPTMYEDLCHRAEARQQPADQHNDVHETIERDITRTFPRNAMFSKDNAEGQDGLDRLRRVLRAYAMHDPEVGYCQGMGFFTAMFLIYMPEEQAFWLLSFVMNRHNSPIRGMFMPDMAQTHLSLHVMNKLVESYMPRLFRHLQELGVDNSMYASSWYLTIFTSSFPFEMVTRVWDAFLAEGFKVVHRVVIALLKCFEKRLLGMEFEQVLGFFHHDIAHEIDVDVLMDVAFKLKLSRARLTAFEAEHHRNLASATGGAGGGGGR